MSREIENQIVKMEFDNKKFEKNVNTSLNTIQKLKKSLNFDEQAKTMRELEKAANHITLDDIGATLDKLAGKFTAMGVAGMTVVQDLTREIEKFAKRSLSKLVNTLNAPLRQMESGGWARAMKIKDAEFTMKGLNVVGEKLAAIKDDIDFAVLGTAFGYESAANAAAQFAASNVAVGDSMKKALRGISGIAAQTNSSYDDIANIFTTIAAQDKIMGMQLTQLATRGMNATAVLAKYLGTTEANVRDMCSKSQISFATFAAAMDDAFGEHAKDANETFQGALDNMKASLSRVGADFATPFIDAQRDVFNSTRIMLNSLRKETGAFDTFYDNYMGAIRENRAYTEKELVMQTAMMNVMDKTSISVNKNVKSWMSQYDALDKVTNKTKEQEQTMRKLRKLIENSYEIDKKGTSKVGTEVNKLTQSIYKAKGATAAQQIVLNRFRELGNKTTYYMGGAAENALERIESLQNRLDKQGAAYAKLVALAKDEKNKISDKDVERMNKLEKSMTKLRKEINATEKELNKDIIVVVGRTNSVARLVETYKKTLEGVRYEVLNFINNPKLTMSINNIVDGLNGLLKFINKLAAPFKNAWRSIFPENEAKIIYNLTEKFRKFMKNLKLSAEGASQFESAFRGVFSVLSILGTILGDVVKLVGQLASPLSKLLLPALSALGEILVTIEWRVRQFSAAVQFTIKYFSDAIKNSERAQKVLSGLSKVVGTVVGVVVALARTIGVVLVSAFIAAFAALDKLAGIIGPVLDFLAPIGQALLSLFGSVFGAIGNVVSAIITPFTKLSDATDSLNQNVGKLGEKGLTPLQKFGKAIKNVGTFIRDFVANGINALSNAIRNFSIGDFIENTIAKVKYIIDGIKSGVISIPKLLGSGFSTAISTLGKIFSGLTTAVKSFFTEFGKASGILKSGNDALGQTKENATGIIDKIKEFFTEIGNSEAMHRFGETLEYLKDKLSGFFRAITPAKLFAVAFTAAVIMMTVALYNLIKSISEFTTFAAQVPVAITGMFDSIKGFFKALKERVEPAKKASTQFKEIAEGIAIVAASIYLLAKLKPEDLARGGIAIAAIVGIIFLYQGLVKAISMIPSRNLRAVAEYTKTLDSLMAMAASIGLMAITLNMLAKIKFDTAGDMLDRVILCLVTMAGVAAVMVFFGRYDKGIKSSSLAIIAFSASLYLIAKSFEKLQGINWKHMWETFLGILPVLGTLFVISLAVTRITFSGGVGMLLVIGAIYAAIPIFEKISKFDFRGVAKVLQDFTIAIGIIAGIGALAQILLNRDIFQSFESFGNGMKGVATSMLIMVGVVYLLGHIRKDVLFKGLLALGALTTFVIGLEYFAAQTVGNDMKQFGRSMLAISAAMTIMSGLIAILGSLEWDEIGKGILAVGAISVMIMGIEYASQCTKGIDSKGMGMLIALTIDIVTLAGTLIVLSEVPWPNLLSAMGAMSATLLAFGAAVSWIFKAAKDLNHGVAAFFILLEMAGLVFVMGSVLGKMAQQDWKRLAAAGGAMGVALLAFGGACMMVFTTAKNFRGGKAKFLMLLEMAGIVGVLGYALYQMSKHDWKSLGAAGVAMGVALLGFAGAAVLIASKLQGLPTNIVPQLLLFVEFAGLIYVIGTTLGKLATHPWPNILSAMGAVVVTMAACGVLITVMQKVPVTAGLKAAAAIGLFIGTLWALFLIVVELTKIVSEKMGGKGTGFEALGDDLAGFGKMIGKIVSGFQEGASESMETIGERLGKFAESSANFFDLMNQIKDQGTSDILESISNVIDALSRAKDKVPSEEDVTSMADRITTMADAMVHFAGRFKLAEIDPNDIKKEGEAMKLILEAISFIPPSTFTTNADGYDVVSKINYEDFGNQLVKLGDALVEFSKSATGIQNDGVEKADIAMGMINAFSKDIPNSGGVIGWFAGNNDIGPFAMGLPLLGAALLRFSLGAKYIDNDAVQKAEIAMGMISAFAKEIPNSGGVIGWFAGNNDIGDFAKQLPDVGKNLSDFSANCKDVNVARGESASSILINLAKAAEIVDGIRPKGLKVFADNLPGVSSSLKTFFESLNDDNSKANNTNITNFCNNISRLAELNETIGKYTTDNFTKLSESLTKLNETGLTVVGGKTIEAFQNAMSGALTEINQKEGDFLEAGQVMVQNYIDGMADKINAVVTEAATIAIAAKNELNDWLDSFWESGKNAGKRYAAGIVSTDSKAEVRSAADTLASLASNGSVQTDVADTTATNIATSMTNTLKGVNERVADFGAAATNCMNSFIGGLDTGITTVKTYGAKITDPILSHLTSSDTLSKFKSAGSNATDRFALGIASSTSHNKVVNEATAIGKAAVKALDKAIADPAGVSDETYRLGNAFTNGFGIGIKNSTKEALKRAAKLGVDSIKALDESIHDPDGPEGAYSADSFLLGGALGKGYEMGISAFNSAVQKAASILGISSIKGLDVGSIAKKIGKVTGSDYVEALVKTIAGVGGKKEKKTVKSLFGGFFDDAKKEIDKATEDMESQIGAAQATGDGKKGKGGGGKNKPKWTNKDLISAIGAWTAITNRFTVKYDAFNSKLIEKGKITVQYLAQSVGGSKKLNELLKKAKAEKKILNSDKSTKKEKKAAEKRLKELNKQIKTETDKGNDLRKAVMAFKDSDIADINKQIKKQAKSKGIKEGTKAYGKLAKEITKGRVKELNTAFKEMQTEFSGIVNNKSLLKTLTNIPSATKAYVKNYKATYKSVAGVTKQYKKQLGIKSDKKANDTIKGFADYLYKRSDEYKKASKTLNKDLKKQQELEKKADKQRKIVNDPKATAKQKLAAKKRLETYKSQSVSLQKEITKLTKEIEKGPEKAIKKFKKEVKSAAKEFVAFSNISFDKVLSGFDKKSKSTLFQAQSFDIFTHSLVNTEEALKSASDAYGLLNVNIQTGINLLERFSKVGKISARRLTKNAESQLKAYEETRKGLAALKEAGLDDRMIKQLEEQGTSALASIRGFLSMTPEQIAHYNDLIKSESQATAETTKKSMDDQVSTYKKWIANLAALSSKIPASMLKELRSAGVSNADFVETLLYMDDKTLADVSAMYSEGLQASVDAAVTSVGEANEGRTFKETIEKNLADAVEKENIIKALEEKGFSKEVMERFKSMSLTELKAYSKEIEEEIKKDADGFVKFVNEAYEKSMNGSENPMKTWADNIKSGNDLYESWQANLDTIAGLVGKDDPFYEALKEMGMEESAAYAEAFVKALPEDRQLVLDEFNRQQDINEKAIIQNYKERIEKLQQWKADIERLASLKYKKGDKKGQRIIGDEMMAEIIAEGPEAYEKVHALTEMTNKDLASLSQSYTDAMKLPESVANSVTASYAISANDSIKAAANALKSDDSKKSTSKALNETLEYTAKVCTPYGKKKFKGTSKEIIKALKTYCNKEKGTEIGEYLGKGLSKGMNNVSKLVITSSEALAKKAYKAMKKALGIKSPSKMTEELGEYFDLGFVKGIEGYEHKVEKAATAVTDGLASALQNSLLASSDILGEEQTLAPVIHPTLDLSGVERETYALAASMSTTRDIVVTLNDKANEDVVNAIALMRSDLGAQLEALSAAMAESDIYLDSGTLVGELAGPMDSAMGKIMAGRRRGM